jgi:hypothetical protein
MNAIILKGAALRQAPLPQSGPRAKTIAHPCPSGQTGTQYFGIVLLQSGICEIFREPVAERIPMYKTEYIVNSYFLCMVST